MCWIEVLHATEIELDQETGLLLQYCIWHKEDGDDLRGYRFMRRNRAVIPQARIPSRRHAKRLWAQADLEGWADL